MRVSLCMSKNLNMSVVVNIDMSLIVSLSESSIKNIHVIVSISLNGISSLT